MNMLSVAQAYTESGLSVIPTKPKTKRPAINAWKRFQQAPPDNTLLTKWFKDDGNTCLAIITGAVSGNLELLDFDFKGEFCKVWADRVPEELRNRLVAEQSQSGGWHLIYRCTDLIPGNLKLAQRGIQCDGPEGIEIGGKECRAIKKPDGNYYAVITMIETRGEGGYFLAAPSPGYTMRRGDLTSIPMLTAEERQTLIQAALDVNEWQDPILDDQPPLKLVSDRPLSDGPGDDYNVRGDVLELLRFHGWQTAGKSGSTPDGTPTLLVTRPGKSPTEHSGSLIDGRTLFVWSTNAAPFESEKSYSPFAIYAMLECGGDFTAGAKALRSLGYGAQETSFDCFDSPPYDNTKTGDKGDTGDKRDIEGQEGQTGTNGDKWGDKRGQTDIPLYSNARAHSQKEVFKSVIEKAKSKTGNKLLNNKPDEKLETDSRLSDVLKSYGVSESKMQTLMMEIKAVIGVRPTTHRLRDEFGEWIDNAERNFNIKDFFFEAGVISRTDKKTCYKVVERMCNEKVVAKVGATRGVYRKTDSGIDVLDWETASETGIDIWLPFGIDKLVNILPGNIIAFAGVQNAGKTGLLMETAFENMLLGANVRYCSSEMGKSELKSRIKGFGMGGLRFSTSHWRGIEFIERSTDFPDILLTGEGNITIIDFLEIHDEFYRMGGMIRDIHDNLDGGVCILALQKNPGAAAGRGGTSSLEKPRLYVNVEKNHIEIVKAKNRKTEFNPNGQCKRFEPGAGGRLVEKSGWYPKEI